LPQKQIGIIIIKGGDIMTHTPAPRPQTAADRQPYTVLDTRTLFARDRQLLICHRGQYYRLQLTQNDKLILVK
jgi:hemin uptake protein HemP